MHPSMHPSVPACAPACPQVDAHFMGSLYTVAALDGQTKHHLEETIRSMATDAKHFCVMCVGHNKGWEEVRPGREEGGREGELRLQFGSLVWESRRWSCAVT